MTISVNYQAEPSSAHAERPANTISHDQPVDKTRSAPQSIPVEQDTVELSEQAKSAAQEASPQTKSLSLDVSGSDYKLKVMVEREVGERKMQTVLNFYKRSADNASHSGTAADTLA